MESNWMSKVNMPQNIQEYADYLYTTFDQQILSTADAQGYITQKIPRSRLENLYRRGVLDKEIGEDGSARFKAAHVASRFDAMVVVEKAQWLSIPEEIRTELNDRYIMSADIWLPPMIQAHEESGKCETVLPIEKCLEQMEAVEGDYFYLAECNCNNFVGGCERDKYRICIHFPEHEAPINSPDGRGLSERVTKQDCIDALRYADQQGLVHKLGPSGRNYCNCCSCCCIHSRGAEKYEAQLKGKFIATPYVIRVHGDACINCQACVRRCPYGALTSNGSVMTADSEKCYGCGVCRNVCPVQALEIVERTEN